MNPLPRISGKTGQPIDLNMTLYRNGVPTDPYTINNVKIYKNSIAPGNIVEAIAILPLSDPNYPSPLVRENLDNTVGPCGTEPPPGIKPGVFHLIWDVPKTLCVPDIFFDVWSFTPDAPSSGSGSAPEESCSTCCGQFWVYPDGFVCDDGLTTIRLGFEPLDMKLNQPEIRTIEVGMMPLPLYDFDYNKTMSILPRLTATINIYTSQNEVLVNNASMRIGIRQGTYRSNPFVLQYQVDSSKFYKGSYMYKCTVQLPNGETRVSPEMSLQIT